MEEKNCVKFKEKTFTEEKIQDMESREECNEHTKKCHLKKKN